jgi:hypothetical protein
MVMESGEKLEGISGADSWPRTKRVHESSRGQVLRFSASLVHRCNSLVGTENRSTQFPCKLAQIAKVRQGEAERLAASQQSLNYEFAP